MSSFVLGKAVAGFYIDVKSDADGDMEIWRDGEFLRHVGGSCHIYIGDGEVKVAEND